MNTDKLWTQARKKSGLARFERTSTRKTWEGRYLKRAWRVPGTLENGRWSMLRRRCQDIYNELSKQQTSRSG